MRQPHRRLVEGQGSALGVEVRCMIELMAGDLGQQILHVGSASACYSHVHNVPRHAFAQETAPLLDRKVDKCTLEV